MITTITTTHKITIKVTLSCGCSSSISLSKTVKVPADFSPFVADERYTGRQVLA